jgi:phosphoenolpyruvate carboxykinase (ATP)
VPSEILSPKNSWKDKGGYDATAKKLAELFRKNFENYADQATEKVQGAGPK